MEKEEKQKTESDKFVESYNELQKDFYFSWRRGVGDTINSVGTMEDVAKIFRLCCTSIRDLIDKVEQLEKENKLLRENLK